MYFKVFQKLVILIIAVIFSTIPFTRDASAQGITSSGPEAIATGVASEQLEHASDDIINTAIISASAGRAKKTAGNVNNTNNSVGSFAMGRLRSTNHKGYNSPFGTTTRFRATEWSAFGAVSYIISGSQSGSRLTISPYIGWTEVDVKLGFGLGSAKNKALLYGMAAVYSVDSTYAALSVTGATGQTDAAVNFVNPPITSNYNTQGVIISALVGKTLPIVSFGDGQVFASLQGGVRHIQYGSDKYVTSASPTTTYEAYLGATTALFSAELYTTLPQGGMNLRPYIKNTLQVDLSYVNKSTSINPAFSFVSAVTRDTLQNKTEIGLNIAGEKTNFSIAAFSELAHDHTTFGGRLGATFKLN